MHGLGLSGQPIVGPEYDKRPVRLPPGGLAPILAVAGPERLAALHDVPTVAEQGYPGFRAETWNGVTAPAGTPVNIMARLQTELHSACADARFRAK
jgi:tripartite-type tricarboxylate transporter receptor subunit TctC